MESIPQTHASVQRIQELGAEIICPGHGKPLPLSTVKLMKQAAKPVVQKKKKEEEDLDFEELTSGLL